jgi:hypothetical protein
MPAATSAAMADMYSPSTATLDQAAYLELQSIADHAAHKRLDTTRGYEASATENMIDIRPERRKMSTRLDP